MPPKGKRAGRPIKKFPEVPDLPNASSSDDQTGHLNTLANAAQSVDFNFEKAWPKLDEASDRLTHLRTLQTDRGLTKPNRTQLINAIDSLHKLLVAPSSILDNTPDLYKDEFKNRATALTGQYLQFSLDVAPKKDDTEKEQYLEMLLDKLIKPIREQPSLWGLHSLQITDSATNWEKLRASVPRPQFRAAQEPSQPYPEYRAQYPPPPQLQSPLHNHGYPPPSEYYRPEYQQQAYPYASTNEQPPSRYYNTSRAYDMPQRYQELRPLPGQYRPIPPEPAGFQSTPVLHKPFAPVETPIPLHRPTPIPAMKPLRNENFGLGSTPDDIGRHTPFEVYSDSPPRGRATRRSAGPNTPAKQRLMELAKEELRNIRKHPARQTQPVVDHDNEEDNDNVSVKMEEPGDNDDDPNITMEPPKRPLSVGSNEDLTLKRKRTDEGMQPVTHERSPSREQMYEELAKEHVADEQYLSKDAAQVEQDPLATTPIQPDDDDVTILPRRPPLRRSKSRAQIGLEEDLTPGIRELMSPKPFMRDLTSPPPREGSPDRMLWRKMSPPMGGYKDIPTPPVAPKAYSQVVPKRPAPPRRIPSHIRTVNSTLVPPAVTPPGGNALGAHSPEYLSEDQPERPIFEHIRRLEECDDVKPTVKRTVLPLPTNASEMPRLMTLHDEFNQTRHVETRDFYVHTRTALIANASEWSRTFPDGTITLGRFFNVTPEELNEIKEYVKYMAGQETTGPKTMIRLVCRGKNGESGGPVNHAWPENTTVILNGKNLMTSMHIPLYLGPQQLTECNRVKFKLHPDAVQGYFSINLEVYSLLSFSEMKSFFLLSSPTSNEALNILKTSRTADNLNIFKARISLLCGTSDHEMRTPVYGKTCEHHEVSTPFESFQLMMQRIDLACFVSQVGVGPEFVWECPLCQKHCGDDIPVAVDKHILGILESVGPNTGREYYSIMSDGQICDETEDDSDDESEDEDEEEDDMA